jgi:hypothetical protein
MLGQVCTCATNNTTLQAAVTGMQEAEGWTEADDEAIRVEALARA